MTASLFAPPNNKRRLSRQVTGIIIGVAAVLIAALLIFLIVRGPNADALPTSLGFSLNSFFVWIGGLTPLAQIPIVVVVFLVVRSVRRRRAGVDDASRDAVDQDVRG